jgi:hypothetical protein
MKINPPTSSDEVKEVIMVMKNNECPNTDYQQAECFKYGGNERKNKMMEIVSKL